MIKKIKDYIKNNPEKILFIFSVIYLLMLGIILTYNYNIKDNINLIFDSDTKRIVQDMTEIDGFHYRLNVHPLFMLIVQPIYFIVNAFVHSKSLSIVIIISFVSSLTVLFLYKTLSKIEKDNKFNIIVSLIYLFSFSNIIFTASPETYNFSALFLLILWYYFIGKNTKYNLLSKIILVVLGIFCFAFTITNIFIFIIVLLLLLIDKKLNIKNTIIIFITVIISVTCLNLGQKLIWNHAPVFFRLKVENETTYVDKKINLTKIKNVVENDYINSIISSDIFVNVKYATVYDENNYTIEFSNISMWKVIIISIFYITLLILLIRNFKTNKLLNIGLLIALFYNTLLHILYGNDGAFLYSEHFLYLIMLLFGVNYNSEKNITIKNKVKLYLLILLIIEIIKNNTIFIKIIEIVRDNIEPSYFAAHFKLLPTIICEVIILLILVSLVILTVYIKKVITKEKNNEKKLLLKLSIVGMIILFEGVFISLHSIELNNRFLIFDIDNNIEEIVPKNKQYYTNKKFKKYFSKELKSLKEYQDECNELMKNYNHIKVNNLIRKDTYYFGLANRKKLFYQDGKLIDIETKKIIEEFDVKEQYVIPNIYTVIIETKNGDYIKIYEDRDGIHYVNNKKEKLLDDTRIELYDFSNQKYQNLKKELYGETLFNIKNETIYSNVIVYDKPWYRDAALTCMVLKQTGNTNLIDEWVNSINEIYDSQNSDMNEADNLGELLYILSTQENINYDLVDRIEEEAERIASTNPNGYYIYGQTDYDANYLYQNLWYKLGIESVGREFKFDLDKIPEDNYSRLAWWSDYKVKGYKEPRTTEEYPYLSIAEYHNMKTGSIPINISLYPMSWERNGTEANYQNYDKIDTVMTNERLSQVHSWSSAEFLLLLLDDTGNLKK